MQRTAQLVTVASLLALIDAGARAQALNPASGRAFALQVCTPCHVVADKQLSPRRFTTAPDFRAIANIRGMTETSLHAFLSTPHPSMPNLILSQAEQDRVIAYILSLRRPQ